MLSFNGQKLSRINAQAIFDYFLQNFSVGDKVEMVVKRKVDGILTELTLSAPAQQEKVMQKHGVSFFKEATKEQLFIRNAWLKVEER